MSEQLLTAVVTIIMAIVGVAILAVLVSQRARTGAVIQSAAGGFALDLGTALSPLSAGAPGLGVTMPGQTNLSFS